MAKARAAVIWQSICLIEQTAQWFGRYITHVVVQKRDPALDAHNHWQRCKHHRAAGRWCSMLHPANPPVQAKKQAKCQQHQADQAVYRAYVEVSHQIAINIAPPQSRCVLAQELGQHFAYLEMGLLVRIHGIHGHILDYGTHRIQAKQHVGFEEVALLQLVERQFGQHAGAGCGVAIGRIHDVPVAATELGHE